MKITMKICCVYRPIRQTQMTYPTPNQPLGPPTPLLQMFRAPGSELFIDPASHHQGAAAPCHAAFRHASGVPGDGGFLDLEVTNLSPPSNHWWSLLGGKGYFILCQFLFFCCSSLDLLPESSGLQSTGHQIWLEVGNCTRFSDVETTWDCPCLCSLMFPMARWWIDVYCKVLPK
jgi:hypothetical protein